MAKNHLKDKKITILFNSPIENEVGETTYVYTPMPGATNIWAYYRHLSGKEYYTANIQEHETDVIFEINWRNDINVNMHIQYRGQLYGITQIDDFEGRKLTLLLYCKHLTEIPENS